MSTIKSFNKNENEDSNSMFYVENLLNGLNEWRNIQDIIRMTFKALCEVVKSQGVTIKELEKSIGSRASKSELNSGLNIKANIADVMKTFSEVANNIESRPTLEEMHSYLDEKISKTDIQYYLNSKPSLEEIRHMIDSRVSAKEFEREINNINQKLDQKDTLKISNTNNVSSKELSHLALLIETKASKEELNEGLNLKINKDQLQAILHKKANKSDVDNHLKNKIDVDEFQSMVNIINSKLEINDFEKLIQQVSLKADKSDLIELENFIYAKADKKDVEPLNEIIFDLKRDLTKKVEAIDGDLDRLIDNIKKEFQNYNVVLNNFDIKKVDFKEYEKLSLHISKKIDSELLNSSINQVKTDLYESFNHYKNEIASQKKVQSEQLTEKNLILEKQVLKATDDFNKYKDKIIEIQEKRKLDHDDTIKHSKQILSNFAKEIAAENSMIKSELQKLNKEVADLFIRKSEKKDTETAINKIYKDLKNKVDVPELDNLFKSCQQIISEKSEEDNKSISNRMKVLESDLFKVLEKKANQYDITTLLSGKADAASTNLAASQQELEELKHQVDKTRKDLTTKLEYAKFDIFVKDTQHNLERIYNDISDKANVKEVTNLLKTKTEIEDVNKALIQVHEELDTKNSLESFTTAMDNQAIINEHLCAENCLARWTWKSGQIKSNYAVPWEIQTVNTAPDNFLWEKEKTAVMVVTSGLYEINMGFYADKKPTVQLIVNGEPVLSAVNSSSYVIHHSSGRLKNVGKHSSGNITGLTLVDFICLPERAKVSVTYSGEEGAEGFLALRKL